MDNPELGRLILKHIEVNPESFTMKHWGLTRHLGVERHQCVTAACLSGHAMLLSGYQLVAFNSFQRPDGTQVLSNAEEGISLLGLSEAEYAGKAGKDLFYLSDREAVNRLREIIEDTEKADADAG